MDLVIDFVQRAERYADRHGIALATLSHQLFNDGKRLRLLKDKESGITVKRLVEASARLKELEAADTEAAT